jgi:hypothetical protein
MTTVKDKINQQAKEMLWGTCSINQPQEPMTAEKLRDILAQMPEPETPLNMMQFPYQYGRIGYGSPRNPENPLKILNMLGGFRAIESNLSYPRFQLSEKVTVSDEFRQEMNAWMADFFGYVKLVPDDTVLVMGDTIVMNSRQKALLEANLQGK